MKTLFALFWSISVWSGCALAEPLVVGFERFHSGKPSEEGGRLLYNELGCVNCHGGATGLPARKGPNLSGVTGRVQAEWIRAFLESPSNLRSGTTMPHVLPQNSPESIEAILHYLAAAKTGPAAKLKTATHVNSERGKELFHSLGCVACHSPSPDFQPPEGAPKQSDFSHASLLFPELSKKYVISTLATFLFKPLSVRPDGRMPDFNLEEQDALDLAGFLLKFEGSDGRSAPAVVSFVPDQSKAEKGRALVLESRCAACHELPKDVSTTLVPLKNLDAGCMNQKAPTGTIPFYAFSDSQKSALRLYLTHGLSEATSSAAITTLEALNCLACHERDGLGGPDMARKVYFQGDHNLGDTGKYPPPLTGIGRKLQPEWLQKVLAGQGRVRPYLQTKMPVYGKATDGLGEVLGKTDAKVELKLPGGDDTAGRKLLGTLGGVGCITCHRWGEHPALGIQALDLSNLGQRIQPSWLVDYLIHPAGYRASTLMPSFWPEGKAANLEILGGDTLHQIASIYSFAKSDNGEPEGFPSTSNREFELSPKEAPIVQRGFLEGVGTHAILVGFPQGFHIAYDGKLGRPMVAWRGRFFDAYSTWFSRFAPFEKVLGDSVAKWPSDSSNQVRFEGYRLDARKVPVFLLTVDGGQVTERFEAFEGGLRRVLSGDPGSLSKLMITHPEGVSVRQESAGSVNSKTFVYLWK